MVQNRAVVGCGVGAAGGRPDPKGGGNVRSRQVETRGQDLDLAGPGFWCPHLSVGLGRWP